MLCVELLEGRVALSATVPADVSPPDGVGAAEVTPEPVPVGSDAGGEIIYTISVPPRQCMCSSCLGTWDGPLRSSVTPEAATPATDPTIVAETGVTQADRSGLPDVIVLPTTTSVAGPVALPPGETAQPWGTPKVPPLDTSREATPGAEADQVVEPVTTGDAEPTGDLAAPQAAEREADPLALGA